jgi:hypothetical protein
MTPTRIAISALLLAFSASGALAQSQIDNGASAERVRPIKAYFFVPPQQPSRPDRSARQPHADDIPWAPF